jgi:hypothetical protein
VLPPDVVPPDVVPPDVVPPDVVPPDVVPVPVMFKPPPMAEENSEPLAFSVDPASLYTLFTDGLMNCAAAKSIAATIAVNTMTYSNVL